ncbi:MAG: hypothetical protein QS748_14910 [Candidatus Endonucleobacter bathymodioli]|uniref:Uncharacterized protein n=1 Tax=Candidatus Endonucleibacter bathymodioli TaxID=539814 RepID=A0AA90NPG2_9GAMM|nr:hypothetical protein [Candidatus Endonucleobacter bathymodioli]
MLNTLTSELTTAQKSLKMNARILQDCEDNIKHLNKSLTKAKKFKKKLSLRNMMRDD